MKYALLSVYDKSNIIPLAKNLIQKQYTLLASGGTFQLLKQEKIAVLEVESLTESQEMLGGRVKTLHPKVHGSILFQRDNPQHLEDKETRGLVDLDLVVCNLYPFEAVLRKNAPLDVLIENIDIGGPTMIRAAAKNYRDVCVCVDPSDYDDVVENMEDFSFREQMAFKAFSHTAQYDALISNMFSQQLNIQFPESLTQTYRKKQDLRYGENPHQMAAYYDRIDVFDNLDFEQVQGKELSYNNVNDLTGTLKTLALFERPTAVAVKHANACGIASADTLEEAYQKAFDSDPISIYGGIVAVNGPISQELAQKMNETFLEIVLAPEITEPAKKEFSRKKNLRVIEINDIVEKRDTVTKDVLNGILIQEEDRLDYEKLEIVSEVSPTQDQMKDLLFAWNAVKTIDSNAIVVAKDEVAIGLGHGEVRRVWSLEKAIQRSQTPVAGSVMASDAFFFEDTIELCAQHGIKAIIQPGGSIKDSKVIEKCNAYGIALVFTGTRHFKH